MSEIALFHSAQGLRRDVTEWADSLREAGHAVWTPDLYGGASFDRLEDGIAHRDRIGIPELRSRANAALASLPAVLVLAGFSMGAATAQYCAATRPEARAAILMHTVNPPERLEGARWPSTVPVQAHYAVDDPWVDAKEVASFRLHVEEAGGSLEIHTYPGRGHLFNDAEAPEFDPTSAEQMLERQLYFLSALDRA